jgi:hypothetical protein
MRSRFSNTLLISLIASATACVTTPKRNPRLPPQQPIEKEGQKIPGGEMPTGTAAGDNIPAAPTPGPAAEDGPGLWSRTNNMQVPMHEDDLMRATQLYPTAPGSLEEAIFVVTQMRMLQKDWERRSAFQTQDLHTNQKADNTAGLSLEKTFQDLEVDLAAAIRRNPALKNHDSLLLAKQLLTHTKNSAVFNVNVNAAIRERASDWPDVLAEEVPAPSSATPAPVPGDVTPLPGTAANPEAPADAAAAVPPVPADANAALDLMGSDTLLIAAQKLADKREYKAALDHVTRIKKEDPFYAQAQEKQKLFSNRAVKDLRQKAAEAFSNAAPLNDTRAKGNYLKQAKNYLEQALKDFPMADQLDTVRENLDAVNRDLEAVDKSGT